MTQRCSELLELWLLNATKQKKEEKRKQNLKGPQMKSVSLPLLIIRYEFCKSSTSNTNTQADLKIRHIGCTVTGYLPFTYSHSSWRPHVAAICPRCGSDRPKEHLVQESTVTRVRDFSCWRRTLPLSVKLFPPLLIRRRQWGEGGSPHLYKKDVCSIINERTGFFLVNSRKARLCSTESPLQEVTHFEGENLQPLQKGFCIRWHKRTDNSQLENLFSSRSLAPQMENEGLVQFIFLCLYCVGERHTVPEVSAHPCGSSEKRV